MSGPWLRLEDVSIGYGRAPSVVDHLSLSLSRGEIGCLLGASGCGKSTLLRGIAGFESLRSGTVRLADTLLADGPRGLAPERRHVGLMFQDYALFPHLSVAQNVAFGLHRRPRAEREARVDELLALVGLADRGATYPHELSGGQQQRVALARALAPGPSLLLLDEPFSNLDVHTRLRLAGELRRLLVATGSTVLLVTHDQSEAFAMADRVGVMDRGHLLQWDRPEALYYRPADPGVASFVGRGSLVSSAALGLGGGQRVLVRPESLSVHPEGALEATLVERTFRGPGWVLRVELSGGERLDVEQGAGAASLEPGASLRLAWQGSAPPTFPAPVV